MKTVLPSGAKIQIGVHHCDDVAISSYPNQLLRGTRVRLTLLDTGVEFNGGSVCKPPDVFSKRDGRRHAANSLLRNVKDHIVSKEDRRFIFVTICPEYKKPSEKRKPEVIKNLVMKETSTFDDLSLHMRRHDEAWAFARKPTSGFFAWLISCWNGPTDQERAVAADYCLTEEEAAWVKEVAPYLWQRYEQGEISKVRLFEIIGFIGLEV